MFLLLSRLSGRLNGSTRRPVHEIVLGSWRQFLQDLRFKKKGIPDAQKQRATTLLLNNITKPDAKVSVAPQQPRACP